MSRPCFPPISLFPTDCSMGTVGHPGSLSTSTSHSTSTFSVPPRCERQLRMYPACPCIHAVSLSRYHFWQLWIAKGWFPNWPGADMPPSAHSRAQAAARGSRWRQLTNESCSDGVKIILAYTANISVGSLLKEKYTSMHCFVFAKGLSLF